MGKVPEIHRSIRVEAVVRPPGPIREGPVEKGRWT